MSAALPVLDAEHPWPGLFPYGEEAHQYFNGRERETTDLLRLVRRDACMLLYGQSGLGKSSLLRAGLFPKLRNEGFLPVYLRLDFRDANLPLRQQAWSILRDAMTRARIDGRAPTDDESLWEYFHAADVEMWDLQNRMVTPVLVFDQFEELVQAAEERAQTERLAAFMDELADLIENRVPAAVTQRLERDPDAVSAIDFSARRFRCVLGFREDFLPDLEERFAAHRIATISRLRITKMGEAQALAAVLKTGGALVDETVAQRIVAFVSGAGGKSARVVEIEPALLSVVCFELNNRRISHGEKRISADLLEGAQEAIIAEFYQRGTDGLDPAVQVFIERELLTESGYRDSCAVEDAVQRHGVALPVIQGLVERRILRLEERFSVLRVELTHDVLAPVVRANRDRRLAEAERAAHAARERERQRRTRRLLWAGGAVGGAALALMFVFFLMFRQAEAEKSRVIEAQSTLFLSRANASLENNVPGEPWRFLARALELNPGNEGALARLVSLAAQRRFARQLWSFPLPTPGEGVGSVHPVGADGFAFLSARHELVIADVRKSEAGLTLALACPQAHLNDEKPKEGPKAGSPGAGPLLSVVLPPPGAAQSEGGARIALAEKSWIHETDAASPLGRVQGACAASRRVSDARALQRTGPQVLRPLAIEQTGSHIWVVDGQGLLRLDLGTGSRKALALGDELGLPRQVWVASEGRVLAVRADSGAALFQQDSDGGWKQLALFRKVRGLPEAGLTDATFSDSAEHALLTFADGNCQMWDLKSRKEGELLWTRACAASGGHRFVPGKPWVALLNVDATEGLKGGELKRQEAASKELALLQVKGAQILGKLTKPLAINHVAFSNNGERVVVSAQDRTTTVHDLPLLTVAGATLLHEGSVVESHFLPGNQSVITASFDGSARVWDWRHGVMRVEPLLHSGPVLFARPLADGNHVLTVGDDRRLRLWRLTVPTSGEAVTRPLLDRPVLSPDGKRVAWVDRATQTLKPGSPSLVRRVDSKLSGRRVSIADWSELPGSSGPLANIRELVTLAEPVAHLAWGADNETLLVAGSAPWLAQISPRGGAPRQMQLPAPVRRMQYAQGVMLVAAELTDDTLRVFDLVTGRQSGITFRSEQGLLDFALSEDGLYLTVATRAQAQVLDARTGYWLRRLDHGGALAAAVHPQRPEVALSSRAGLLTWRPNLQRRESIEDSGEKQQAATRVVGSEEWKRHIRSRGAILVDPGKLLVGLRYARDGHVLGSFSVDGVATAWAASTLEPGPHIRHSNSLSDLSFSSDGRWMVTVSLDGDARVWDHRTGQLMTDAIRLSAADVELQVIGRGTWALKGLGLTLAGASEPLFLGLGFEGSPPTWVVPTASAVAGVPAATVGINVTKRPSMDESWWLNWLDHVASRNGATRP